MTIGLSVLAAQYWGKGDAVVAAFLFPLSLMQIFTDDRALMRQGAVYLRTISVAYLLTGMSQIYLCVLKNTGRAFKSSVISSVSVLLNIILNAVLIFGLFGSPKMEIAGAAHATVIARSVEVVWCCLETMGKKNIRLRWKNIITDDKRLRRDFWRYTLPILGNEIVWGIGFTMYSVIMGHLGSDAVASNSIANIAKKLIACFCIGLGNGGGIMVGLELGAGRLEKAKNMEGCFAVCPYFSASYQVSSYCCPAHVSSHFLI